MIVKMIKNLENKMEKMQESINKDLKERINIQRQATQLLKLKILSVQFSHSVVSALCDPMNSSTPGLPVHHQLLEFTQTHVH